MATHSPTQPPSAADEPTVAESSLARGANETPNAGWHVNHVLFGLVIAMLVAGLLSSGHLVDIAASQEFGPDRDRWLDAATQVDDIASGIGADQPGDELADRLDRNRPGAVADPGAGDDVVLGALADEAPSTGTTLVDDLASTEIAPTTTPPADQISSSTAPAPTTTTTAPTTTTTQRQLRSISAEEPLLIWTGGDSLGEYVATGLLGGSADLAISDLLLDYHISTGLTRPDFFDWPAQLSTAMIEQPHPEAVVFMVGGNDNQAMITEAGRVEFGTDEWRTEYRLRVATMMDITGYPDSHMIWIGLPVMRPTLWEPLPPDVNTILAEEAALRPWVTFLDIDELYRNEDGEYDQYIVGPDGDRVNARAPDGVHITRQGSKWIADLVWQEIQRIWVTP